MESVLQIVPTTWTDRRWYDAGSGTFREWLDRWSKTETLDGGLACINRLPNLLKEPAALDQLLMIANPAEHRAMHQSAGHRCGRDECVVLRLQRRALHLVVIHLLLNEGDERQREHNLSWRQRFEEHPDLLAAVLSLLNDEEVYRERRDPETPEWSADRETIMDFLVEVNKARLHYGDRDRIGRNFPDLAVAVTEDLIRALFNWELEENILYPAQWWSPDIDPRTIATLKKMAFAPRGHPERKPRDIGEALSQHGGDNLRAARILALVEPLAKHHARKQKEEENHRRREEQRTNLRDLLAEERRLTTELGRMEGIPKRLEEVRGKIAKLRTSLGATE